MTFTLTAQQLAAFKSFAESKCIPDMAWRQVHEPYTLSGYNPNAESFAFDLLGAKPGYEWDVRRRPYAKPEGTIKADAQGLNLFMYGMLDPKLEDGSVSMVRKTWSLSWAEVVPNDGYSLSCYGDAECITIHTIRNFRRPDMKPWETADDSTSRSLVYAAPYTPMDSAYSDFNRAVLYLWYQHQFLNQTH